MTEKLVLQMSAKLIFQESLLFVGRIPVILGMAVTSDSYCYFGKFPRHKIFLLFLVKLHKDNLHETLSDTELMVWQS